MLPMWSTNAAPGATDQIVYETNKKKPKPTPKNTIKKTPGKSGGGKETPNESSFETVGPRCSCESPIGGREVASPRNNCGGRWYHGGLEILEGGFFPARLGAKDAKPGRKNQQPPCARKKTCIRTSLLKTIGNWGQGKQQSSVRQVGREGRTKSLCGLAYARRQELVRYFSKKTEGRKEGGNWNCSGSERKKKKGQANKKPGSELKGNGERSGLKKNGKEKQTSLPKSGGWTGRRGRDAVTKTDADECRLKNSKKLVLHKELSILGRTKKGNTRKCPKTT